MNDFNECLKYSHQAEDLPIWKEIYSKAFPTMVTMINHRQDGDHQRQGIDRSVILSNSKQILIDEKVRRRNYKDIALEYISNDQRNTPGWVCKPLLSDYIAYAIPVAGQCYLLPVLQLQLAWTKHKADWMDKYKHCPAENPGYKTWSLAVPVPVLFAAIGAGLRITFQKPKK